MSIYEYLGRMDDGEEEEEVFIMKPNHLFHDDAEYEDDDNAE